MDDPRNHLAWDYVRFLDKARPDGFIFENVTGLLNIEGGRVFAAMREAFSSVMPSMAAAVLSADLYAIPQRRKRVILVGGRNRLDWQPPAPVTSLQHTSTMFTDLPRAVSVQEALDDLPELSPSQDGRNLPYRNAPKTTYQAFMRGYMSAAEYLHSVVQQSHYIQD